ncbi:MAG TPA: sporulation protein YqfD [Bacillota bacterium]|nr:sporulation protein YqfD [Bacillota bacterium]NMD32389.1 sporulation protein YqfD [Bacillota bacterium]HOB29233.1 sporulation protein YqfD [Bacillota bacterium]HPZ41845.1 sporulation protein YqfD [Bacillota bacterium]HQD52715.1 sporulation protein YqfD [Bacillota bacterium]
MFILRWWRFFQGFVVVSLQGRGVERLLNLAVARGIGFWDLQKQKNEARLCLSLASFKALRPLVRQTHCRLHIERKVGLPFIKFRLRRRWGLVVGLVIFIAALYLATSFVWYIRVSGTERLEKEEVLALVEQLGVRPGIWKKKLNLSELAEELPRRHSAIAWAGLRLRGILLEIEIVEHLSGPVVDDRPADLIASKDGLIERMVVIEGKAAVKVGDTVSKGDLLIEGVVSLEEGILEPEEQPPVKEVRARGKVEARVWYEAKEPLKLKQTTKTVTGRSSSSCYLRRQGKEWRLWGPGENPYEAAREESQVFKWGWRNLSFPVEVHLVTYREIKISQTKIPYGRALPLAQKKALQKLRVQIPGKTDLEQLYFEEYTENGVEWVRAVAETREEISTVKLRRP